MYHYAAVKPGKVSETRETIDLKIYREAENKDVHIARVEHVLKENAIDCETNRGVNLFVGEPYNQSIEMIDSRNNRRMETLNDTDYLEFVIILSVHTVVVWIQNQKRLMSQHSITRE